MKQVQPIKELTVNYEGEEIKVFRQEMLEEPSLGDALTSYERLLGEIADKEYELKKCIHAKLSMMNELKQLTFKHVAAKKKPKNVEEKQGDSSE